VVFSSVGCGWVGLITGRFGGAFTRRKRDSWMFSVAFDLLLIIMRSLALMVFIFSLVP